MKPFHPAPHLRAARAVLAATLLGLFASHAALAQSERWVASWGTAQLTPSPDQALPADAWRDGSIRQLVRASAPGRQVRVRLSNAHGPTPLQINAASVGLVAANGKPDLVPGSVYPLTFNGETAVMIPAGAEYLSDPVPLAIAAGADVGISLHFLGEPHRVTGHAGSRATTFMLPGNKVLETTWANPRTAERWVFITGLEVLAPKGSRSFVAIGDSITDGYGVKADTHLRWTDGVATRLREAGLSQIGVVNAGIGGGRMLREGLGPALVSRFERDVLMRPGVSHALVFIGVNDMGSQRRNGDDTPDARARMLADLKLAHTQLAARAHDQGVCLIGATVTPYAGSDYYRPSPANEADRQALNDWIRKSGVFDAVADFDAAVRDPARPDRLAPESDNDGLHPNMVGLKKLADAVPLDALRSCRWAAR